jgi:hypothetical protein
VIQINPILVEQANTKRFFVDQAVNMKFSCNGVLLECKFYVMKDCGWDVLLGQNFLNKYKAIVDFEKGLLNLRKCNICVDLGKKSMEGQVSIMKVESKWNIHESLDSVKKAQMEKLLNRFSDLFDDELDIAGAAKVDPARVILEKNVSATWIKPYRFPHDKEIAFELILNKFLEQGVVEEVKFSPSANTWNFNHTLVKKKDNSWRPAFDCRKLNNLVMLDRAQLPSIDSILDQLDGAKYFSKFDFLKGYLQIPLNEDSKDFFSFSFKSKRFRYKVLPFGFCNAPGIFQRIMDGAISGLPGIMAYLDDSICHSDTWGNHLIRLEALLLRFRELNFKLNKKKCEFGRTNMEFLGHEISKLGTKPLPSKVEAIEKA